MKFLVFETKKTVHSKQVSVEQGFTVITLHSKQLILRPFPDDEYSSLFI